jgi:hypothetical protein
MFIVSHSVGIRAVMVAIKAPQTALSLWPNALSLIAYFLGTHKFYCIYYLRAMAPNYAQSGRGYHRTDKEYDQAPRKVKWHWSFTVTIIGMLLGGGLSIWMWLFTEIPTGLFLLLPVAFGAVTLVLQWKKFYNAEFIKKHGKIHVSIFTLYNIGGLGFMLTALFLAVNWIGAGEEEIDRYRIVDYDPNYIVDPGHLAVFALEGDAYADSPMKRAFEYADAVQFKKLPFVEYRFYKGLLGFRIYDGKRMAPDPDAPPEEEKKKGTNRREQKPATPEDFGYKDTLAIDSMNIENESF